MNKRADNLVDVPELPQMQALSERLEELLTATTLTGYKIFGFSGLKTASPSPDSLMGQTVTRVGRRGKYLVIYFDETRLLIHLSQAGRLDVENPPKTTKPKGSVTRLLFDSNALLLREYGTERKAGWWILAPQDNGPLEKLGPEAESEEFNELIRTGTENRQIHTLLRDQKTVAGIGRGYSDDALHLAKLSPFSPLKSLNAEQRENLIAAIHRILSDATSKERQRKGGLSQAKLGDQFLVHNRHGTPCPTCAETMKRVSFESHEITYCAHCQTGGKVLADRRLSRLLK